MEKARSIAASPLSHSPVSAISGEPLIGNRPVQMNTAVKDNPAITASR